MKLFGMGAAGPDILPPDDYLLAPTLGLATVASGLGTTRIEARTAAVLATWGVVTELEKHKDEHALLQGFERASKAISRLSYGWDSSLVGPTAMNAALHLEGTCARIVHVGRCRVSQIGADKLVAITHDHGTAPNQALGVGYAPTTTNIEIIEGDELLLASHSLQVYLTPEVIAQLCRKDRPLIARAIDLWDHATRLNQPFAFIVVRAVSDNKEATRWTAGSARPQPKFLPPPGEAFPPLPIYPFRGPDESWEKEVRSGISHDAAAPLAGSLGMVAEQCTFDVAIAALLGALRWCLQSIAARKLIPPASVDALQMALARTNCLEDWGIAEQALVDDFYFAASEELHDWGAAAAIDWLVTGLECLREWAADPAKATEELGGQLNQLANADARWEWDDGRADVLIEMGELDKYWDQVIVRDEQEVQARRAFLLMLADLVD